MSLFRFHSVHAALDWHMTGLGFLQWFDHLIDLENKRHFRVTEQEPACRTSIPVSWNLSQKQKQIISKLSWQSFGECKMEILQEKFTFQWGSIEAAGATQLPKQALCLWITQKWTTQRQRTPTSSSLDPIPCHSSCLWSWWSLMQHYCQVSHTRFDFFVCSHQEETTWVCQPWLSSQCHWTPPAVTAPKHRTRLWECSPQVKGAFTCPPENSSQISSCFWPLGETSGFSWMGDLNLFHNRRLDRTKWVWDKLIPRKFPHSQQIPSATTQTDHLMHIKREKHHKAAKKKKNFGGNKVPV